ncbi:hypothetical protein ACTMU2_05275 [Cupriavidus basilensis]
MNDSTDNLALGIKLEREHRTSRKRRIEQIVRTWKNAVAAGGNIQICLPVRLAIGQVANRIGLARLPVSFGLSSNVLVLNKQRRSTARESRLI